MSSKPIIVLIHGAITDASVWNLVAKHLQSDGYTTIARALPLRSLHTDAEYVSSILATLNGPFVLVGHSFGGSVTSHPTLAKHSLKSLVFVSAFIQDSGETAGELNGRWPGANSGRRLRLSDPIQAATIFTLGRAVLLRSMRAICPRSRLRFWPPRKDRLIQ